MSPESTLTGIVMLVNVALALAAVRVAWWLFRSFVRGTGKAWRGEA
jgi:hypothetical protein